MEIPPPYEDTLQGAVISLSGRNVLLAGDHWQTAVGATGTSPAMQGHLTLRYGIPLATSGGWLIPRLVVDDHRRFHSGLALFEFVEKNGSSYPRADALGLGPEGQELDLRLRDLDIAQPPVVLAYPDATGWTPTRVNVAVWLAPGQTEGWQPASQDLDIPALLRQHVTCYQLDAAQAARLPDLLKTL